MSNTKQEPTVVAEIYHAKLGASGASGWMNCPAWQGGGAASVYAARGSVTHEVSANALIDIIKNGGSK